MTWAFAPSDVLRDGPGGLRFAEVLFTRQRRGTDPLFTDVTLQAGWNNYSGDTGTGITASCNPAGYRLCADGMTYLRGVVSGTTGPPTLYVGLQAAPLVTELMLVLVKQSGVAYPGSFLLRVDPSGAVTVQGAAGLSVEWMLLDGRHWRAF